MSDSLTLADLAKVLATPGFLSEFKIHRALNLDGGTSSGFYFDRAEKPIHVRPIKRVRNFVGIYRREKG